MRWKRRACLCALPFVTGAASQQPSSRPIPVTWDTKQTYGPDGPWQGVQVSIGTGSGVAKVTLYPGGSFDSNILTPKFCNGTSDPTDCKAAAAGLYDPSKSPSADFNSIGAQGSITGWQADEAMNLTGQGVFTLDTMTVSSLSTAYPIPQSIFSSIITTDSKLPNGSSYPVALGNLALGSPNPVQTFLVGNGSNVTGQLLTGYLANNNQIPSSSWGLHIGSAALNLVGSLVLGGYDQSRIIGNVAAIDTTGVSGAPVAPLVDAGIGIEAGGTPFNTTQIPSLFRAGGNATMQVMLNPLVPYMFLPQEMCDAFAQWLPITYSPNPGVYVWNTDDSRYQTLIKSPAYLSFTFQNNDQGNLTVKVPFSLLNLTLESPLVASPTPYFPCKPFDSPDGTYFLGRAFLQAAYLSINWDQNKFFFAQAAGPGAGQPNVQTIQSTDQTLQSNPDSAFLSTWQSKWTTLPANASSSTSNGTSVATSNSSGLSKGAIAGVGAGVGVAALILLAGLIACLCIRSRRRKAAAANQPVPLDDTYSKTAMAGGKYDDPNVKNPFQNGFYQPHFRHEMEVPPPEMDAPRRIHEANPQTMVHEAPSYFIAQEIDSREVGRRSQPRTESESLSPVTARTSMPGSPSPVSPRRSPVSSRGAPTSPMTPEGMI